MQRWALADFSVHMRTSASSMWMRRCTPTWMTNFSRNPEVGNLGLPLRTFLYFFPYFFQILWNFVHIFHILFTFFCIFSSLFCIFCIFCILKSLQDPQSDICKSKKIEMYAIWNLEVRYGECTVWSAEVECEVHAESTLLACHAVWYILKWKYVADFETGIDNCD